VTSFASPVCSLLRRVTAVCFASCCRLVASDDQLGLDQLAVSAAAPFRSISQTGILGPIWQIKTADVASFGELQMAVGVVAVLIRETSPSAPRACILSAKRTALRALSNSRGTGHCDNQPTNVSNAGRFPSGIRNPGRNSVKPVGKSRRIPRRSCDPRRRPCSVRFSLQGFVADFLHLQTSLTSRGRQAVARKFSCSPGHNSAPPMGTGAISACWLEPPKTATSFRYRQIAAE